MSHELLPEKQPAWKNVQEKPGRKAQRPKILLMCFRQKGLSNIIFKSICGHQQRFKNPVPEIVCKNNSDTF